MKRILPCLFILLVQSPALYSQKTESLKWVVGTWKINTGNGTVCETWELSDDSTLRGKSSFIKQNKDTIPQENLQIAFRNGDWYYISTVVGQNNNQPVSFKIIFQRGTEFISENPAHDFPQRIAYRRVKQQLFASIEGKNKGKYSKQNFDFNAE
jgi:hypothetical protein